MAIQELVDKYIEDIHIDEVGFTPQNGAPYRVAYVLLDVPKAFVHGYLLLKCTEFSTGLGRFLFEYEKDKLFPEGQEFWSATKLRERLRGKKPRCEHQPLEDILGFLGGSVDIHFSDHNGEMVSLKVYEVPRLIDLD